MKKLNNSGKISNSVAIGSTVVILCIIGFLVWLFGWSGIVGGNNNNASKVQNSHNIQAVNKQAEENMIKANWEKFFNGKTDASEKAALLENGQQYLAVMKQQASSPTAKATTATVSNVKLSGNSQADVTYTVNVNNQPMLKNQAGQAVKVNGIWKVSDGSFCSLLKLENAAPPQCPGGSSSTSSTSNTSSNSSSNSSQTTGTSSNKTQPSVKSTQPTSNKSTTQSTQKNQ